MNQKPIHLYFINYKIFNKYECMNFIILVNANYIKISNVNIITIIIMRKLNTLLFINIPN